MLRKNSYNLNLIWKKIKNAVMIKYVDRDGIGPSTSSLSVKRSTSELPILIKTKKDKISINNNSHFYFELLP